MPEQITATIEIAATPEHVWAVLADLASYPQWHPVFRQVTGQLAAGSRITLTTAHPATERTMTATVKVLAAEPGTELRWVSNVLGVMRSERSFTLSPADGGTLLRQTATYRGLFARFPAKTITSIQDTVAAINQAIKEQAEARQRAPG
jgi:hypothetical protein